LIAHSFRNGGVANKMGNSSTAAPSSNNSDVGYSRRARHAGSWYSDEETTLNETLSNYLAAAAQKRPFQDGQSQASSPVSQPPPLRAIICPHAGYSYSGPTAAHSYHHLQQQLAASSNSDSNINSNNKQHTIRHILVLHPSHHVYLDGCAVSGANAIETPLGTLTVDQEFRSQILNLSSSSCSFTIMKQDVDEAEHSGEMQYPYLVKAMQDANLNVQEIPVLPIMCGNLSTTKEAEYGKLLAPFVSRKDVLCVISTDFCHWGRRFSYQPQPSSAMQIYEYIQQLDQQGMTLIELQQPGAFAKYLRETRNTICGRHAVLVWLQAVVQGTDAVDIQFVSYAQSSKVQSTQDSSVSYAAATARARLPSA
jgi:hypothetical protein